MKKFLVLSCLLSLGVLASGCFYPRAYRYDIPRRPYVYAPPRVFIPQRRVFVQPPPQAYIRRNNNGWGRGGRFNSQRSRRCR